MNALISVAQDAVKTTTLAPSSGQNLDNNHGDRRIPITTPKTRPQSPDLQQRGDSSLDENKSNSQRESVTGTATIRVEKNPNFTPSLGGVTPNEYTTISAAGKAHCFEMQNKTKNNVIAFVLTLNHFQNTNPIPIILKKKCFFRNAIFQ